MTPFVDFMCFNSSVTIMIWYFFAYIEMHLAPHLPFQCNLCSCPLILSSMFSSSILILSSLIQSSKMRFSNLILLHETLKIHVSNYNKTLAITQAKRTDLCSLLYQNDMFYHWKSHDLTTYHSKIRDHVNWNCITVLPIWASFPLVKKSNEPVVHYN